MLQQEFARTMEMYDDLVALRRQQEKQLDEWEGAILDDRPTPDVDFAAMDDEIWRHPANAQCILVAQAITRGAAEAYGWRRYWRVLAISERCMADERKAWRYAKQWARQRKLMLEGVYWTSPFELGKVLYHVEVPPRFDATMRQGA